MPKHEYRMAKEIQITKLKRAEGYYSFFSIRASSFFRHSSFGFRHS
jgi:hypothetical protein